MVKHSLLLSAMVKNPSLLVCHAELNEASVQLTNTLLIKSCETQRSSALCGEQECEERGEGVNKKNGAVRMRKRECERQLEENRWSIR